MGLVCTNCILAALTKPSELLDPKYSIILNFSWNILVGVMHQNLYCP